ncbi:hypothetical protein FH966_04455 [Lentibacillus cibarius]|uniref:Large ribosomal subunit protein bL12 C-terminal domain-containing protein n=1 Tax=Lentibacillus cibarius TaxID=2583219 RepID=A0A549YGS8_9BACI|nr:ribosomal protein L7/L12 [Lentibacillus cibarius]TRM11037.1 hypothetical protein FH966_04455 [Lentibacillus cibarius]
MSTELIKFGIIVIAVILIWIFLNKSKKEKGVIKTNLNKDYPELAQEVKAMLQQNKKDVVIIKYVREKTGLGLVDAKEFVDKNRPSS